MDEFVDPYSVGAWCVWPLIGAPLSGLERAIYSTIAYHDVFDFAPNLDEIHRYLHGVRCTRADVGAALNAGLLAGNLVATDGEHYALSARADLLQMRRQWRPLMEEYWPVAIGYGRVLAGLPNVRMIALTGSFAAGNIRPGFDIDYMVLTEGGKLWRTRALAAACALVARGFGFRERLLCPNYFMATSAMEIDRQSTYVAHELALMIPLFGMNEYEKVRGANDWVAHFLPNADGAPDATRCLEQPPMPRLKKFVEIGLDPLYGPLLEIAESARIHRKGKRLNWTPSSREIHGTKDHVRNIIEEAWQRRLQALDWSIRR